MGEEEASKKLGFEKEVVITGASPLEVKEKDHTSVTDVEGDEGVEKHSGDLMDRDTVLANVVTEKRLALIEAWEESEKTKAEIKAHTKLSAIGAWENTKIASVEAQLMQIQEELEKEKAIQVEKMNNKMAKIQKTAEEKRALVESNREDDILKVEEEASKFRTTGRNPNPITMKIFKCFGFKAS